jgi:hypothetical protein
MSRLQDWPFESAVREVTELLVQGEYGEIEGRTAGVRLSALEIGHAVKEYGRRLVVPSNLAALTLDVVPITAAAWPSWSVQVPIWTAEEGRSDLTLELTARQVQPDQFQAEVDNLHVL